MKNEIKTISINIERLRKEQNRSQIGLSRDAKIAPILICQIEGGNKKNISIKTLNKIAKALNVEVIELLK